MKPIIKKIWTLIMMMSVSIPISAYNFSVDGIYYNILTDKTSVEVTYRNTNYDTYIGEIVIPSEVSYNEKKYTVTGIGSRAFYKCSTVTSITLPTSINKIGSYAFEGANHIQKVYISDLSAWCMIDFNNSYACPLVYGGTLYLNNEPVTSLESLDSSCTTIAKYAFYNCTSLTNVILPEFVTSVQELAFTGCSNLSYLEIGPNVINLEKGAFKYCTSLKSIKFVDSNQTINLGQYETNKIYSYFKDCPLTDIYIGRDISWATDGVNYEYYDPFTKVKSAIFNTENGRDRGFSNTLTTVYIGPKCKTIYLSSKNLTDLFIFTNDITSASLTAKNSNIYVIDKSNLPEKLAELTYQSINDLVTLKNLQNDVSYVYGNAPSIGSNNFENNVIGMTLTPPDSSLDLSVGYHKGISATLSNNLWDVTIELPFSYSITPAPLTIIANNATKTYGSENPELTCSYFGFKNGETEEVLTNLPSVETTATQTSNVGTYPIIPFGAEAQNYTFTYERGTLTITKADQTIEWDQSFDNATVGDIIELTATSSAGLPIKYSSTDESVAEIFTQNGKKHVEFLKAGKVSIRANQEGNENYNEADRVSKTITVEEKSGITGITDVTDDNSDISIRRIGSSVVVDNARDSDVTVYSISGYILYQSVSYDSEEISLPAGLYLIKSGNRVVKFKI